MKGVSTPVIITSLSLPSNRGGTPTAIITFPYFLVVKFILVIMFLLASGQFGRFGLERYAKYEQASNEIKLKMEHRASWRDEIFLDLHMFAINI